MFVWLGGCIERKHDARLELAYRLSSENPDSALKLLGGIERKSLSEADRHYYDFVLLRGRDKGYITHKSDSLYLSVLHYAEDHKGEGWYPEAVYYGGRVYSDLGDYPTALKYYHQALDLLPKDGGRKEKYLRGIVVSQTGRLLDLLRMHKEAIPYILESLHYDSLFKDTVNLVADMQLLSGIYTRDRNLKDSKKCLYEALAIKNQTIQDNAHTKMLLAEVYQLTEQYDSALYYIKGVPQNSYQESLNCANIYAASIYHDAGLNDSAVYYATKVISHPSKKYLHNAYKILIDPNLSYLIPKDSIYNYNVRYHNAIENMFDENQTNLTVSQQALYNYSRHYESKLRAEKNERIVICISVALSFVALLLVIIVLFLRNKTINTKLKLICALDRIAALNQLEAVNLNDVSMVNNFDTYCTESASGKYVDKGKFIVSVNMLRERLQEEILNRSQNSENLTNVSGLIKTDIYRDLCQMSREGKYIKISDSVLWENLEKTINDYAPQFKEKLELLTNHKLTEEEYHTCLLVKLGLSPTQLSNLMLKAKSTISSRRVRLGQKMFEKKFSADFIDEIIKSL